jgi:hypothetical protein
MTTSGLRNWLDRAWDEHADHARRVAGELAAQAAGLPDDDDGAEAVRLARHTLLGHLADPAALRGFLAAVPGGAKLDPMRERAEWVLASFEGRPAAELPQSVRWGLVADVAQAEIESGRLDRARERIFAIEAEAATHTDEGARRAYAATCNNLALALRTGARGDAARDALMLDFAALARRAWQRAGNWMNVERADYQLAMCHAVLGQGAQAQAFAQACLACCEANGADAAERFFAHEAVVHAHSAAGDAVQAAQHRERMAALLDAITDPGMNEWCRQTLART